MKLCSNNKKLKTSKENIFSIFIFFTFNILQINKLSNIFFRKKKNEENEEFYGKNWKKICNKRILQKFPNLERKISSSISNCSKVWSMHIKTIRKESKNNPFARDDNIENNFLKNYFPNMTNQYLHHNIL